MQADGGLLSNISTKQNRRPNEQYENRNGKIANLPSHLRDELNLRIACGDEGIELVEWLNSKLEVADVVNKLFDGTPISKQCTARKRNFQNVAERPLHRGRSLKTCPNGANAAARSGSRTAILSMNPSRFPTTTRTSPPPASTPTNSFSPSPAGRRRAVQAVQEGREFPLSGLRFPVSQDSP